MATLGQRKAADGSAWWKAVIRMTGHPHRSRTFRRKTDATDWAAKTEAENLAQVQRHLPNKAIP